MQLIDAINNLFLFKENDLPQFMHENFGKVVENRGDFVEKSGGRESIGDVVEDEADHGFFLHTQVLFYFLGDPGTYYSLHHCVCFQHFVVDCIREYLLFAPLKQYYVYFFAFC